MYTIVLDAETYYNTKNYTLKKLTPVQYIMSEQYQTIGWAVAIDDRSPVWLEGDKLKQLLVTLKGKPWVCITHNALFDCCILAWRYDVYPTLCIDTMTMARALLRPFLPNKGSVALGNVADYLGVGTKDTAPLNMVNGMRLEEIKAQPQLYADFKRYGLNDADITRKIYNHLKPSFTTDQFLINHMLIEMATKPQFTVNYTKLLEYQVSIEENRNALLQRSGLSSKELMSSDKFASHLRALGIEPPLKTSPATGKPIYAFAKTDKAMEELADHPSTQVQALVEARLGIKSTIERTRCQRFLDISAVTFDGNVSWMPVPLNFSGAHTHRFSGAWDLNLQNLPSRNRATILKESLTAPEGQIILAVDAAQIEARLTAWLSKETELVELFATGADTYSAFASEIYGYKINKKEHPTQRFLGKTAILGLGFGMGAQRFMDTVRVQANDQGIDIDMPFDKAQDVVNIYRRKYKEVQRTWYMLDKMITRMHAGTAEGYTFGPCTFHNDRITLPSKLELFYRDLLYNDMEGWTYWDGRFRKQIWGGTMLENVVQALDHICIMEAAIRIRRAVQGVKISMPLAHVVHDELVYVPFVVHLGTVRPIVEEEMGRRPTWGLDLPVAAESKIGYNYGELK